MRFTKKQESNMAILAAILVLFTSMLDPRISVTLSVLALLALAYLSRS